MRLRLWIRRIGAILGTVAIGALIAFLIPTIAAEYSPQQAQPESASVASSSVTTEIPIARAFITAFVANDQARLKQLGADEQDAVRANDLAMQAATIAPPVLLGSIAGPGISIQAYAAQATMRDGTKELLSWRVVTVSGRATLIPEPDPLSNTP
jgi:hypothetical protein